MNMNSGQFHTYKSRFPVRRNQATSEPRPPHSLIVYRKDRLNKYEEGYDNKYGFDFYLDCYMWCLC